MDIHCSDCDCIGPNLWLCLQKDCLHVGCSEKFNDHSTKHFKLYEDHCVHINLSTKRIWCYVCEVEVFFRTRSIVYEGSDDNEDVTTTPVSQRYPIVTTTVPRHQPNVQMLFGDSGDENQSSDSDELSELAIVASNRKYTRCSGDKHRGLVGLQNIGNTCYMNSALQALSNTLPLTSYFLECNTALQIACDTKKPGLSRTYQHLMKEIWNKKNRGYVVPSGILYGIRNVYPMFRGYHQHDTQEFLRCFMDQLHEELKELHISNVQQSVNEMQHVQSSSRATTKQEYWRESPSPSQSDGEYETCDSGVSERSSLSDDTERVMTNGMGDSTTQTNTTSTSSSTVKRKLSPDSCISSGTATSRCKLTNTTMISQYGTVIDTQPNNSVNINDSTVGSTIINKQTKKYRSIISDIFDGKLLSSVQCLTCDRISTRIETFQDLSLPIPGRDHITMLHQSGPKAVSSILNAKNLTDGSIQTGLVTCADTATRDGWWSLGWLWGWLRSWFYGPAVSLHDCLAAFFSADELKGDNMYSCEKCNKLRNGVKFSKVIELPEVLCIHLKRFRHELMFSSKISNYVSFPMNGLDMRPYLHRDCISEVCEYDLNSVICHHGTAGAGHYTCYALNHQRNAWFEFDDQCVTEVSPETVESCEAYVLFYRKCARKITPIRQTVSELMEMQGAGDMRFYISRQWFTRFQTCAEPGSIDNSDFLCIHGAVKPNKMPYVDKLSIVVSQPVWEYLLKTFRGGPTCNHLYECPICGKQAEAHLRRIHYELETFFMLNKKFQLQSRDMMAIYAISMKWFRCWQAFVRNETNEPPGPIDNTPIIIHGTNNINLASDYAQISEEMWIFLHRIYGGGPIIQLRSGNKEVQQQTVNTNTSPLATPVVVVPAEPQQQVTQPQPNQQEQDIVIAETEATSLISGTTVSTSLSTSGESEDDGDIVSPASSNHIQFSPYSPPVSSNTIPVSPVAPALDVNPNPVNTFTNPTITHISPDLMIPGLKRPPKIYTLHASERKTRRRRRSETTSIPSAPQTSHQQQEYNYIHGKYNKYSTTSNSKRRLGPKKRTYNYRRNSIDDLSSKDFDSIDQ